MPRRNIVALLLISLVSLVCYRSVQSSRAGRVLSDAIERIEQRYLEPIDEEALFEGAMQGMVSQLDDYSAYIPPVNLQEFNESLEQQFGGVGMEVGLDPKTNQLTVMSPLVGSPAYEAGIRPGDKILRIDGKSTQGMSLKDSVALMHGDPGEPVTITIQHEGEDEPVELTIIRAIIQVDTVLGDTRNADGSWNFFLEGNDKIGYLRINTFAENTAGELREALEWLVEHDMQALILDLRDDPGGLLNAAVDVCDTFIESGVIVSTRGRDGHIIRAEEATPGDTFTDFPMAVLVNHMSASASEIVAACLQDHKRAIIVGQRTWGKGTVQEVVELDDNRGALKLTTASYWRPSEKNIHRRKNAKEEDDWGVSPDKGFELKLDEEEESKLRIARLKRDIYRRTDGDSEKPPEPFVDPQLNLAVEYLEKVLAEGHDDGGGEQKSEVGDQKLESARE